MLDPLHDLAITLKQRALDHQQMLAVNAYLTRAALIDPILQLLGWDVYNPANVMLEYETPGRKRVDYSLMYEQVATPVAFLEAKRLNEPLNRHVEQILARAKQSGVPYAGLSDGNRWLLYYVPKAESAANLPEINVSLSQTQLPEFCVQMLTLWRPRMASRVPDVTEARMATGQTIARRRPVQATPEWMPLDKCRPQKGDISPKRIRFPDGEERDLKAWRGIMVSTTEWLVASGCIERIPLPLNRPGGKRPLLCSYPAERPGDYMEVTSNVHVYFQLSSADSVKCARLLLDAAGQPNDSVQLLWT